MGYFRLSSQTDCLYSSLFSNSRFVLLNRHDNGVAWKDIKPMDASLLNPRGFKSFASGVSRVAFHAWRFTRCALRTELYALSFTRWALRAALCVALCALRFTRYALRAVATRSKSYPFLYPFVPRWDVDLVQECRKRSDPPYHLWHVKKFQANKKAVFFWLIFGSFHRMQ